MSLPLRRSLGRRARIFLAAAITGAVCGSGAAGTAAAVPAPPPPQPRPTSVGEAAGAEAPAARDFSGCLKGQSRGDLLLLLDQSGSLRQTDPQGVRVQAASLLLQRLSDLATRSGVTLNVAIEGFDTRVDTVSDWAALTAASVPGMQRAVDGFATRNTGIDTDYWTALDTVRQQLAARGANQDQPCQAVVMVTDGKFDLEVRRDGSMRSTYGDEKPEFAPGVRLDDPASVVSALDLGRTSLCRPGGVADQLRALGVTLFALGLQAGQDPADFSLLQGIATGTGGSAPCGDPGTARGDFRLASNVDELLFKIDFTRDSQTHESGVCAEASPCLEDHPLVLDPSIDAVDILAGVDQPGISVGVIPPGAPAETRLGQPGAGAGDLDLTGTKLSYKWLTPRTVSIHAQRSAGGPWTGKWAVHFVDTSGARRDTRSRTQITVTSDVVPKWDNRPPTLRQGQPIEGARFVVVHGPDGSPAQIAGAATITVGLLPADGRTPVPLSPPLAKQQFGEPVTLDLRAARAGAASVQLVLSVATATVPEFPGSSNLIPGTKLADQTVTLPVTIAAPATYPTVAGKVQFDHGSSAKPRHGSLAVAGPGCVWLEGTRVLTAPDGAEATVSAAGARNEQSCIRLKGGERGSLPLTLTLQHTGNGTVAGDLRVALLPESGTPQDKVTVPVAFVGNVVKPANTTVEWAVLVGALILGLGLPPLLLYAAKWWTARIPGIALFAGAVDATVSEDHVRRGSSDFAVSSDDVRRNVPVPAAGARHLDLGAFGVALQTKIGRNPAKPGYVVVDAHGTPSISGVAPYTDRSGTAARLPLAVHNNWVALVPSPLPGATVRVLLLVSGTAVPDTYAQLSESVNRHLPRLLERLRGQLGSAGAAAGGEHPTPPPADQQPAAPEWFAAQSGAGGSAGAGGDGSSLPGGGEAPVATAPAADGPDGSPWEESGNGDPYASRARPTDAPAPPRSPGPAAVPPPSDSPEWTPWPASLAGDTAATGSTDWSWPGPVSTAADPASGSSPSQAEDPDGGGWWERGQ